jgi:nitroreductase
MELYDVMSTLRAVRRLRPDPIPDDVVERVLTAATWAPSGGNHQSWRVIAVTDPALKQGLENLYRPHWEAYIPGYEDRLAGLPPESLTKARRSLDAGTYLATHMHEAPIICVFCFNTDGLTITDAALDRPSVVGGGSLYPAVQNLLLAARQEGLGCVLTTLLCTEEPKVKALLKIPEDWHTYAHVPLGYPVGGGHGPLARRSVDKMAFSNTFGQPLRGST